MNNHIRVDHYLCRTGFWPFVHPLCHLYLCRGLGLIIAVLLLLAFVERPSSLSITSDPHYRLSPPWEPPCGLTESIEIVCLLIFSLDLAVKVNWTRLQTFSSKDIGNSKVIMWLWRTISLHLFHPQSYLIGWEEFRKNKWLIGYTVVISISVIDWVLSVSMVCDEVRASSVIPFQYYCSSCGAKKTKDLNQQWIHFTNVVLIYLMSPFLLH